MATSSRQSALFGVNDWKTIYQTFRQADFQSYDYETLRKSFIDYIRLYYPETFNDYTESSEFIALLDVIAYMGQAVAFRNDLNTRENFIDTAERRDSVIKLANLVSYTPKRNSSGHGYLKVTGLQTTENITDINGIALGNIPILWNDPANPNWQEQFNTIINATLINSQRIGRPGNTNNILGIKTDEYAINYIPNTAATIPFTTRIDGTIYDFELVSVTSVNKDFLYEVDPYPNSRFNIVYRNDKLGYGSPSTGFFFYFKQGILQTYDFNLQQKVANQSVDINIQGINNDDTWLYEVDKTTGKSTLWNQVENVFGAVQTDVQGSNRKLYSVTSRFNDQVSYAFGDGVFGEMPVGQFRAYVRAGNALQYVITPSEMQGITVNVPYVSRIGRIETLTVVLELQTTVTTAQARETLTEIKQRAPRRFYTQNRMVNGEDYNNFPYTLYNAIIKSKAINRSSVGVSRTADLTDPTGKYSSVNTFGTDGALYENSSDNNTVITINSRNDLIAFVTERLSTILGGYRCKQYYYQNFPRYNFGVGYTDGVIKWHKVTVSNNNTTGYFTNAGGVPIPTGVYSGGNLKYASPGALVKISAPGGQYFDDNNRLVTGAAPNAGRTYFWTNVINIAGDGYNGGSGTQEDGTGPVVLNHYVPNGATITQIIPVFGNEFSTTIISQMIARTDLNQSFTLRFDNSKYITQERWSVNAYSDSNYFVNFVSLGNGRYNVIYRALSYYFGSVTESRFTYDSSKVIYDPVTGKSVRDHINILKTNTLPNSLVAIGKDIQLTVVGQTIESDGLPDDYAVEIACTDSNDNTLIRDPDFFKFVTGYTTGATNKSNFVFFQTVIDNNLLSRNNIIPTSTITYSYPNKILIETVKHDYPVGQIFYAHSENVFYKSILNSDTGLYTLSEQSSYTAVPGRQLLNFQYRHNSGNTTRIDPATTNIIDLYLVTQDYYTQYNNWLHDSTNTIVEPARPVTHELNQVFDKINDYKMLSDSVILNSVKFKPLFGNKADPSLRATIKVIKSQGTTASDSEIRTNVLNVMNDYFDIQYWDFGDTFYFSELSAYVHSKIGDLVNSIVIVPNDTTLKFGDLYEIRSMPYEIFANGAQATDIVVISALTPTELQNQ